MSLIEVIALSAPLVQFDGKWTRIDSVALDAVVSESHSLGGEPTMHPVEEGDAISDYYRPKPRTVEIEGIISDTPIRKPGSHADGITRKQYSFDYPHERYGQQLGPIPISIMGPPLHGHTTGFSAPINRVIPTWLAFVAIVEQHKIISIVTRFETYTNMVITCLDATPKGHSYAFRCKAQQIRVVSSAVSDLNAMPAIPRAVAKKGTAPVAKKVEVEDKPVPIGDQRTMEREWGDKLLNWLGKNKATPAPP